MPSDSAPAALIEKWYALEPSRRLSMSIQTPSDGSGPSRRCRRRTMGDAVWWQSMAT